MEAQLRTVVLGMCVLNPLPTCPKHVSLRNQKTGYPCLEIITFTCKNINFLPQNHIVVGNFSARIVCARRGLTLYTFCLALSLSPLLEKQPIAHCLPSILYK